MLAAKPPFPTGVPWEGVGGKGGKGRPAFTSAVHVNERERRWQTGRQFVGPRSGRRVPLPVSFGRFELPVHQRHVRELKWRSPTTCAFTNANDVR